MAAAPVLPDSSLTPEPASLSEGARIIDTFIAPSKTFTDLGRNAKWWSWLPPFVIVCIFGIAFFITVGQKIGFRKVAENQIQASPKAAERMDKLPADQREQAMERQAKGTQIFTEYFYPVLVIFFDLVIAVLLFATFTFVAGVDVKFKTAFAIVAYAGLPGVLKLLLAMASILAGMSPDSFTLQNPVATNPGYFMNPSDSAFLFSLGSSCDLFLIWTLILTAIGFTCVSKVKTGTSFAIVFGWWLVFALGGAGFAAMFS
jgi:hypothetical protein